MTWISLRNDLIYCQRLRRSASKRMAAYRVVTSRRHPFFFNYVHIISYHIISYDLRWRHNMHVQQVKFTPMKWIIYYYAFMII